MPKPSCYMLYTRLYIGTYNKDLIYMEDTEIDLSRSLSLGGGILLLSNWLIVRREAAKMKLAKMKSYCTEMPHMMPPRAGPKALASAPC